MMKLDHINLPVSNLGRSRDWWVKSLGLKVEFEVPDTRTVALNDGEGFAIFLHEKPNVAPNGIALWFQVDDVDATYAELLALGVRSHSAPEEFPPDSPTMRIAFVQDPDGNLIELVQPLGLRYPSLTGGPRHRTQDADN